MKNQSGFTLIELVVVIVILGILAAVAVPKFIDLRTDAANAAANGVFGGAQSAAALNHAKYLVDNSVANTPAGAFITTGALLFDAMDGIPDGWTSDGKFICIDSSGEGNCTAAADEYVIEITGDESSTQKAELTKRGTVTW